MIDPRRAGAPEARPDSQPSLQKDIVPAADPIEQPLGVVSRSDGYRMIETFEAENFRCFESLKLSGLKRINVITGENAAGKTALLEALLAAGRGNAEAFLLLNQLRGISIGASIPGLPPVLNPTQFPELWSHWFYSSKKKLLDDGAELSSEATKISFQFTDSVGKHYVCEFTHDSRRPESQTPITSAVTPFVTQRRLEGSKSPVENSAVTLNAQGQLQSLPLLPNFGPSTFIFTASMNYNESENVMWFSQMRQQGESQKLVEFFSKNFPFITNLEVLQPSMGSPAGIYATLTSGEVRRLQFLSSGIYKIISILLGCAHSERGVVLIDEIENGIFYDKYALVWYILDKFSKDYGCQLFVTSHSLECLQRLAPIMDNHVDDFALIHAERENGTCNARTIRGTAMKAALLGGNEIRGGNGKWASRQ
jgi:hypothetical protein